ncbi:MAG TPA: hydantoinase B/oxoprolinase family protein [Alphaproteobacteria bacterium]|nr:hydantoinase B/oxoprolinase family protein [Alphaproteobacteria bacterium]
MTSGRTLDNPRQPSERAVDPVTLQVFQQRLIGIVREMRATMVHSAFSAAICELFDLSCALLSARGELIVQSEDNPQHIFPLLWSAQEVMRRYGNDIRPDDVFLHNDPYEGGTHLNDIAIIVPFFVDGQLVAFPVVRAHWEDVGGSTHGSISGQNREIFQEGLRIPLTRLKANSPEFEAFMALLFSNMRIPNERRGDFDAMMGTSEIGRRRLAEVVDRYGVGQVLRFMDRLLDQEETRMRAKLRALPEGAFTFENYLDPRPDLGVAQKIAVRVAIADGRIEVSFDGSSPQIDGPFNIGPSGAPTGVFIIAKSLLDPKGPVNSGSFRPISVDAPAGSFVNAVYPAAVGAMGDVRRSLESTVMAALASVLPDRVTGDTKGTSNQLLIGGRRPGTGHAWLLYEAPAGGTGGFEGGDGNSTLRTFAEGDFSAVQPVEAIEQKFPLRVEEVCLRADSAGDGKYRGGLGMRRVIRLLVESASLSSVSDKNVVPPYGLFGGTGGAQNKISVERGGKSIAPSRAPGKISNFHLRKDDRVIFESSGGGGYGDPLDRDPDDVARDVSLGYVSASRARQVYGVVVSRGKASAAKTGVRRRALLNARVTLSVALGEVPANALKLPTALVHPATARKANLRAGQIGELLSARKPAAPIRIVIATSAGLARGKIVVARSAARFHGWASGHGVRLRALPRHVDAFQE